MKTNNRREKRPVFILEGRAPSRPREFHKRLQKCMRGVSTVAVIFLAMASLARASLAVGVSYAAGSCGSGSALSVQYSNVSSVDYFRTALAPHGTWMTVSPYGKCWRPSVCVGNPSWQPYVSGGRWVSTGLGWYWESEYVWGWAPFHYGQWYNDATVGWVWAPGVVWAPSWVSWRQTPSAWVCDPRPPVYSHRPGYNHYHYNAVRSNLATTHPSPLPSAYPPPGPLVPSLSSRGFSGVQPRSSGGYYGSSHQHRSDSRHGCENLAPPPPPVRGWSNITTPPQRRGMAARPSPPVRPSPGNLGDLFAPPSRNTGSRGPVQPQSRSSLGSRGMGQSPLSRSGVPPGGLHRQGNGSLRERR